jgi:hypothetical protein
MQSFESVKTVCGKTRINKGSKWLKGPDNQTGVLKAEKKAKVTSFSVYGQVDEW